MKIIFDSEEQKECFVKNACVRYFDEIVSVNAVECSILYHPCKECW